MVSNKSSKLKSKIIKYKLTAMFKATDITNKITKHNISILKVFDILKLKKKGPPKQSLFSYPFLINIPIFFHPSFKDIGKKIRIKKINPILVLTSLPRVTTIKTGDFYLSRANKTT
jgi:hypothetical protein